MRTVAVIAAAIIGAAFVLAGASKVAAGKGWFAQAAGLGVPRVVAMVVPWLELAIGAALVVQLATPWPAVAALLLLMAFTGLIALRLAEGKRPPCACFGAWSAKPIGPTHIARNAALMFVGMIAMFA